MLCVCELWVSWTGIKYPMKDLFCYCSIVPVGFHLLQCMRLRIDLRSFLCPLGFLKTLS